jgi:hypothetical protein
VKAPRDDRTWPVGWEDARQLQLTRALEATPAQRLAWLEEMIAFAHRTGALPRPDAPGSPRRRPE